MRRLITGFVVVFGLLALSIFAYLPLLRSGFFFIHDYQHIARLFELDKSLATGQFPVRWVQGLGFGYGYPLFNFYPPLTYYFGEIFHKIGFGFMDSIKIVWLFALTGSAVSMYFFAKHFFGRLGGIISAVAYLYAPYHAVDAYVRGALAELFSFVWLPLILLFVYKKKPVWAGVFLAILMVTHNLIFLPFFAFFAVWALIFDKKSLVIAPIVAFGLSAFFYLPALAEKQYTLVDQLLIKNLASYKIHFVCLSQFWYSPWGFGGSGPGCFDGLSFMVGRIYLGFVILGLLIGIWKKSPPLLISFGLFIFAGFMATDYSHLIWDLIPPLWYLQFPWRFMEFMVLFSAFLAGSIVLISKRNSVKLLLSVLAVGSVIWINAKYFQPQTYYYSASDKSLTSQQEIEWHVSQSSFEYLPKGMTTYFDQKNDLKVAITAETVAKNKYEIVGGNFSIENAVFKPDSIIISGNSTSGAVIRFSIDNFPGWQAKIDGTQIGIDDNNQLKLIQVVFPPGKHALTVEFKNTPVRLLGNAISVISFLGLIIWIYATRRNKTQGD